MLFQKRKLSKWYLLLLIGAGAISASSVATANDVDLNLLTEINTDRDEVVRRYAETWYEASGEDESTLLLAFNGLNTNQLLAINDTASFDEVRAILLGLQNQESVAAKGVSQKLATTGQDLLYTPVVPCRIINTNNAGGVLSAGTTRDFKVYGNAVTITAQGGNAAGCPSPRGEPSAVHMNVTAVPFGPGNKGNIRAFPTAEAEPQASLVNFTLGTNIANAATIKNCRFCAGGGNDITLKANFSGTNVIVDVLGYYYEADSLNDTDRLALGYASYRFDGVKRAGTENMGNATWVAADSSFAVPITGETYNASTHSAFITIDDTNVARACDDNIASVSQYTSGTHAGKLKVRFLDVEGGAAGTAQQCDFHALIYKNSSLVIFIPPVIVIPPLVEGI